MKIKQLKEKTIKGFIDFLPKVVVDNIEGLSDILNDKLSKSQGGEIKKPIVVTNDDSNYKTIINPDGSIYVFSKNYNGNIFNIIPNGLNINISANNGVGIINIHDIVKLVSKPHKEPIYDANYNTFTASGFKLTYGTDKQVLLGDGSTTSNLIKQISIEKSNDNYRINKEYISGYIDFIELPGATSTLAGLMTAYDKVKLDDIENKIITDIEISQAGEQEGETLEGVDIYLIYAGSRAGKLIGISNATTTVDGCMSHEDKAKLDDIENTYLPLSGGTLTGTLRLNDLNSDRNGLDINNVNGIQSVNPDKVLTPEVWTTNASSIPLNKANGIPTLNENGKIDEAKIDNLRGYVSSQNGNIYTDYNSNNGVVTLDISGDYDIEGSGGRIRLKYTEDGKGKMSIMIDGTESSVNAEKFNSIINPNKNEVWCTDGSRLNILTLLSNAAIYVAGGFEIAESGLNDSTVVDNPDSIIFDKTLFGGRFLARKGLTCYTHWKADISKNIAPPSRYGIETDNGVFPFNNQMYKFSNYDNIYIATCSNGTCSMKKLTLK